MYRVNTFVCGALAAAVLVTGSVASAASLNIQNFTREQKQAASDAMSDFLATNTLNNLRVETFEDFNAWDGNSGTTNIADSNVGSFTAKGVVGNGSSVVNTQGELAVRNDDSMAWGRFDTRNSNPGLTGGNWLDSNDNQIVEWNIAGKGKFDTLSFFIVDAADVGGVFSIKVGDQVFSNLAGGKNKKNRLPNGNIMLVQIALDEAVDTLTLELGHNRSNDGFGIDGVVIGDTTPAPVPVPPALAFLLTGLLSLAGLRQRRRAA